MFVFSYLAGVVPEELGNLADLVELDISNNGFEGWVSATSE